MCESIRVVLGCKSRCKRCLFLRPSSISERGHRRLSTNIVELANEGHGRDGAHGGREGGKLYRAESMARWSREGSGSVRSGGKLYFCSFCFRAVARMFQPGRKITTVRLFPMRFDFGLQIYVFRSQK